ncbi:uncharacterized protein LOC144340208 [Macaca mulatta]
MQIPMEINKERPRPGEGKGADKTSPGCLLPRRDPTGSKLLGNISFSSSPLPHQGAQPHTPSPACRPSPPISGACAPDPAGADPWGRPGFLFLPGPAPPPPGSTAAGSPGPRREEGTHLVGVTCCFGPSVPSRSRRRPQSPAPSPAQARPPHPRPAPGRPTGGRDRVLLGSFSVGYVIISSMKMD